MDNSKQGREMRLRGATLDLAQMMKVGNFSRDTSKRRYTTAA